MVTPYRGQTITLLPIDSGFVELRFDRQGESVNKLDATTLGELKEAVTRVVSAPELRGVLLTSAKDAFLVGADVTEFLAHFGKTEEELTRLLLDVDALFSTIEDLECPSVAAIDGVALGGGFELCLAASYRVSTPEAKVGLPETRLGIAPGWGGTVRLSRLAGADNAIEWIAGGEHQDAATALKIGAVDAVVARDDLRAAALAMLDDAARGELDWRARRAEKKAPLRLDRIEAGLAFAAAKAFVAGKAGPHYPAPVAAIEILERAATLARDEALAIEARSVARLAKTPQARALVSVFLGDMAVKKLAKQASTSARPVRRAAVLGAGIMGGGIAYQSASRGIPILMKDIAPQALETGVGEAVRLLEKQVDRGRSTPGRMARTVAAITPTLSYGDFGAVDLVVEAVVESEEIKRRVLAEVEATIPPSAVLASNTSTISITRLASALARPERFCGMHFFNPVPRMPLVEVIRGERTSPETIATTVAYAQALGKTPIVVQDCPGFLVNRVLFPYFAGFLRLVDEGVDYERIDRALETWGWPMGPAVLLDVVGLDTAVHAHRVMAAAFPDRMGHAGKTAIERLVQTGRLGQKNGKGFYTWRPAKKGPPTKHADPEARATIGAGNLARPEPTDEEIVERAMLPMLLEASRCLEGGIVLSPVEVDIALLYGLGFPPFRGGLFHWADTVGAAALLRATERHRGLGALYAPTTQLSDLAASGRGFHGA